MKASGAGFTGFDNYRQVLGNRAFLLAAGNTIRFVLVCLPLLLVLSLGIAVLVAGSYPQEKIYLLQHVFNNWFAELSVDKMAAGSVLLCLLITIFVLLLHRSWGREEMS